MTDPVADRIARIMAAVVEYLAHHPNARDSARGIRDCWLPEPLQGSSQEDVERALHKLVEEGRISAISVLHNPMLYARAPCPPAPPGKARREPGKPP